MLLVTGATGHLGRLTLDFLLRQPPAAPIAALVRDPAQAANLAARGVTLRTGNYADYASLVQAFAGVDTLLFISSNSLEGRVAQHANVINAAKEAGVRHIAYTSVLGAQAHMAFVPGPDHHHTEQLLAQAGLPYTVLRNTFYVEVLPDLLGPALASGQWHYAAGTARATFAARADMAEALARVGMSPAAHAGRLYDITGSATYSFADIAALLSSITGRPLTYVPVPAEALGAGLRQAQIPEFLVPIIVSVAESIAAGELDAVSPNLGELLGRAPQELKATLATLLTPVAA